MLFNSFEFIIFFPICTILYFLIPHKFRWVHLLVASCIFYAAFIPAYLLILFFLILVDYSAGILIEKENKKFWLILSVVANISILGLFKYYNFFIGNFNNLIGTNIILLKWVLPIGLSFHTFQSMSYTIEVYYGRQKAIKHLGYYALYVMFYPQLVAGPIERPQHIFPQLFTPQKFSSQKLYEGLRLMAWGFFKKLVIADRIGQYVDEIFNHPQHASALPVWLAVVFFSIQIYADFSGYSDIAIGAARCMGFELSINFNRPYQSINIKEFWKRWHISLSSWFRDYVYIPLGGSKKGMVRKKINLITTFLLSALWHGAGFTFIIWGALHALYTLIYDGLKNKLVGTNFPTVLAWLITTCCVSFAWIFFRATSLSNAIQMVSQMGNTSNFTFNSILNVPDTKIQMGNFSFVFSICMIAYMFLIEKFTTPNLFNLNSNKIFDVTTFVSSIFLIIFFGEFQKSSFIYFQF